MRQNSLWRAAYWATALLIIPIAIVCTAHGDLFPLYQAQTQDLPVLLALPLLFLLTARWAPNWQLPDRRPGTPMLLALGCLLVLLLGWGTYALMGNLPLSRDEHMVVFDMAVFDKGRLATPLDPAWRAYAQALVPAFLLNADDPIGLVSAYLPANALLRLAFSKLADPVYFNPVLVLVGGLALVDIARRQFGADQRARWVVLLVYCLSAQMLVTAMTAYAMTAHMALNMVWLAAFLRGGRSGHAVAIVIGFLATGLHQLVFHPLFVAPFLIWKLREGEWRIVLLYAAAYAAILGWWVYYPHLTIVETGAPAAGSEASQDFFTGRVLPLLLNRNPNTIILMMLNLLRFVAWQHLALLPLLIGALPLAWRSRTLAGPLFWGIGLMLAMVTIILPFQGHGWGYRYLHPLLGSFALLAGYGYQRLATQSNGRVDAMVIVLSALTLVGAIPILMIRTEAFLAPQLTLERFIAHQTTTFVLVDTDSAPSLDGGWAVNAIDHVRNLPDLSNRPLRFSSRAMDAARLGALCRRGTIGIVTRSDMQTLGFALNVATDNPAFDRLVAAIAQADCIRPLARVR